MLDVGQGLSILVQADGEYLLYDGGGRGASSYVVAYLQQHAVTELEWLAASHYDEDHISGLVGVLHTTPVEQALMPDYTTDTQIYQSLQTVLGEKNVPVIHPAKGDTFSLGEAEIQVVGPQNYDYDSDNDESLCLRICYGDFQCLLTGDAEQDAEQDMVASGQDLTCDLYVVGHHGSSSSTSEELLDAASPAYAFLTDRVAHQIQDLINTANGHTLVLFTSYDQMGRVYEKLKDKFPVPVLQAQRNPQIYLERFKQLPNAVLFASGACWEGVDFPGDMVSLLIIVKLPFQVPDPLGEAMRKQYGNLHSYIQTEIVPEMQIKLRQGFGRAIRTETDSCVVAILDPRAAPGGRYHRAVLDALPEMPVSDKLTDIQSFLQSKKNPSYFEPRFPKEVDFHEGNLLHPGSQKQ